MVVPTAAAAPFRVSGRSRQQSDGDRRGDQKRF
jgi:hypothetical protein